ncbi:succinate dehydrogenase assembly factor 2 [Pelagibaculum spongiae]|uniref:Uncharacterized protein n=1 Tax=Pelagibaculum spongiae TaxID=2080658 RepID=A0A2V1H5X4_9GAMM|nr:succinate dehydrogenase assembly factor 2 [Pelagibaculum spongiae]PVZ72155.1 hypothetical protein DC094_03840 [Pelagibaculum spongiae]
MDIKDNSAVIAVITGDLIASQNLDEQHFQQALTVLSTLFTEMNYEFDLYRGDSFQVIVPPKKVIELAILARLSLKAIGDKQQETDARISIGIGHILRNETIRTSNGSAFIRSGIGLDKIKHRKIVLISASPNKQIELDLLLEYVDKHISELTKEQARVLLAYLAQPDISHEEIGRKVGKSRANTTKILNKANYHLLEKFLTAQPHLIENLKK